MKNDADYLINNMRGIAIEPTYFDLKNEKLNVSKIVTMAKKVHANAIRVGFFSHNGYAYYQSKIAPKAPGLGDRDLLNEFKKECERANLHLVIYTNATATTVMHKQHPEWVVCIGGKPKIWDVHPIAWMCLNSPYYEYYKSIVEEIVSGYNPETMYVDGAIFSFFCQCPYCREKFKKSCGAELPMKADWEDPVWHKYRNWIKNNNRELWSGIVRTMKKIKPDLKVVFNRENFRKWLSSPPEESALFAHKIADGVHVESSVRFVNHPFTHINEQCMFGQAINTPVWVWVEYPVMPWSHLSCPPAEIKIKTAKVIANGAKPMVWSIPQAPDCDNRGLSGIKEMYGLVEKNERYFNDVTPIPFAAILSSTQTGKWYVKETEPEHDDEVTGKARRYKHCFQGISKALLKNHIPFGIILDEHINADYLSRYKVLILPNTACMSNAQCAEISKFVLNGGGVIATYETSLYDERGNKRKDFGLKNVFGCHYIRNLGEQNDRHQIAGYMEIGIEHPVTRDYSKGFKFPVGGEHLGVKVYGKSKAISTLLNPTRYFCDYYGKKTNYPGMVINKYGKGKVVYIPGEMGLTYYERGFIEHKKLINNAVQWLVEYNLPVESDLPETVDISLMEINDGSGIIIHLINCTADLDYPVEEVVPITQSKIKVRLPHNKHPKKIFSLCSRSRLRYEHEGKRIVIALPTLHEYECIVVEV